MVGYNHLIRLWKVVESCHAQCKLLLLHAKPVWGANAILWFFSTFAMVFLAIRSLVGHENTQRWVVCCYKGLLVYHFRFFCIVIDCAICTHRACDTALLYNEEGKAVQNGNREWNNKWFVLTRDPNRNHNHRENMDIFILSYCLLIHLWPAIRIRDC